MTMHPFKEFVDHIYVLTCTKYRNTRAKGLMETIGDLGLSDITDLMISTCSPIDMLFKQHIDPVNAGASQDWVIDLFLNHYHAVKNGYDLGYNKILILEDDACILKDQEKIRHMLGEIKDCDYPCVALDFGGSSQAVFTEGLSRSPHPSWGFHNGHHFNGTHAYILNRVGMERWVSYCELTVSSRDDKLKFDVSDRVYPHLLTEGESLVYPSDPIVIQYSAAAPGPAISGWNKHYRDFNVDPECYFGGSGHNPLTVVYASDGNDYDRLRMSVFSVRKFLGASTKIILLTDSDKDPGLPGTTKLDPAQVLYKEGLHTRGWNRKWPFATLFRLAIPLLDQLSDTERVLYLDTDVLCRSAEARTLAAIDFHGYEAYAAFDHESKYWRNMVVMDTDLCQEAKTRMNEQLWKRRGARSMVYANAGVVLWNLEVIRANGLDWYRQRLKWFWEAECRGKFGMLDQDFLNVMMDTNPGMSKLYNWFGGDINTSCIFQHFCSGSKRSLRPTAEALGWTPATH